MMDTADFAFAHAAAPDGAAPEWERVCAACLDRLGDASAAHTLGFVYVADAFAAELGAILAKLAAATGVPHWVGGIGIGVLAGDQEYFDRPAIAVMTARLAADSFRLIPTVEDDATLGSAALGAWVERAHPAVSIVHGDPRNARLPELIVDLAERTNTFLIGGLVSSRSAMDQVADGVTRGGLSGVMLAGNVSMISGLSQGCSPIGPQRRVTRAERNVLIEIDDRPALEALVTDIGEALARDLRRIGGLIHVALPIPGSDTGDYLVRNLTGIDPERGLVAIGDHAAAGQAIMFCRRDRAAASEDLTRMLRGVRRRAGGAPKAGLYFSCLARGPNLFGPGSAELAILRRELGEIPLVGMFCNGEISNNRLYGYTGVLALFV